MRALPQQPNPQIQAKNNSLKLHSLCHAKENTYQQVCVLCPSQQAVQCLETKFHKYFSRHLFASLFILFPVIRSSYTMMYRLRICGALLGMLSFCWDSNEFWRIMIYMKCVISSSKNGFRGILRGICSHETLQCLPIFFIFTIVIVTMPRSSHTPHHLWKFNDYKVCTLTFSSTCAILNLKIAVTDKNSLGTCSPPWNVLRTIPYCCLIRTLNKHECSPYNLTFCNKSKHDCVH